MTSDLYFPTEVLNYFDRLSDEQLHQVMLRMYSTRAEDIKFPELETDSKAVTITKRFLNLRASGFNLDSLRKMCTTDDCWTLKELSYRIGNVTLILAPRNDNETAARAMAYRLIEGHNPLAQSITSTCKNKDCVNPEHLVPLKIYPSEELPKIEAIYDRKPKYEQIAYLIRSWMSRYGLLIPFQHISFCPWFENSPTTDEVRAWYQSFNRWPEELIDEAVDEYRTRYSVTEDDYYVPENFVLTLLIPPIKLISGSKPIPSAQANSMVRFTIQGLLELLVHRIADETGHKPAFIEHFVRPGVTDISEWLKEFDPEIYERLMFFQDPDNLSYGVSKVNRAYLMKIGKWQEQLLLPPWLPMLEGVKDETGLDVSVGDPNWLLKQLHKYFDQYKIREWEWPEVMDDSFPQLNRPIPPKPFALSKVSSNVSTSSVVKVTTRLRDMMKPNVSLDAETQRELELNI